MTIIEIEARSDGGRGLQSQSHRTKCWLEGWIAVPLELEQEVWDSFGYCDLDIQDGVLVGITPKERPTPNIEPIKQQKIAQSKIDLAAYLETHPLQWSDGEYYSITSEKQAQLTSKIMAATMAQTMSQPYTLTWNSTGEVCKEWTLQDLSALAFAIDARVTSLVTYQQTQEVAMRNVQTLEELEAIVVDYDSVEATVVEDIE